MTEHFEQLWEQAEQISIKFPTSREELFMRVKQEIEEYMKLDNIPSKEIQNILKTKKMGEILYRIAELSRIDNINTFAALQLEVQYMEKKD